MYSMKLVLRAHAVTINQPNRETSVTLASWTK